MIPLFSTTTNVTSGNVPLWLIGIPDLTLLTLLFLILGFLILLGFVGRRFRVLLWRLGCLLGFALLVLLHFDLQALIGFLSSLPSLNLLLSLVLFLLLFFFYLGLLLFDLFLDDEIFLSLFRLLCRLLDGLFLCRFALVFHLFQLLFLFLFGFQGFLLRFGLNGWLLGFGIFRC